MAGIMSLMPALVGLPIAEVIAPLSLTANVRDALCDGGGLLGALLHIAECSENGDIAAAEQSPRRIARTQPEGHQPRPDPGLQWANDIARENGNKDQRRYNDDRPAKVRPPAFG